MPLTGNDALGLLRGPTTEEFLQVHLIRIAGDPGHSQDMAYDIFNDGANAGGKESFRIQVGAAHGSTQFGAHSVQMVQRTAIAHINAINGYLLDNNGSDIMVTGMLSGCSFVMKKTGNNIRCAHIQPAAGASGNDLKNEILAHGAFAHDAGPLLVFGRQDYPGTERATIIGVRRGGQWAIYAQIFDGTPHLVRAARIL